MERALNWESEFPSEHLHFVNELCHLVQLEFCESPFLYLKKYLNSKF